MLKRYLDILILVLCGYSTNAQQFIGNSLSTYTAIQNVPYNPAWVANAETEGAAVHLFSVSALAGSNAFKFNKKWILGGNSGKGVENQDYVKDLNPGHKYMWGNVDVLGPSVYFNLKNKYGIKDHNIGIYTRYREIIRGGNFESSELKLIGDADNKLLDNQLFHFKNAGFTFQSFAEIGFTYGKVLRNDEFSILKAGATIKYVMGFSAGTLYLKDFTYNQKSADSIDVLQGNFTTAYTYNVNPYLDNSFGNDISAWFNRAGKGSLGLDIGVQYEYHPFGSINEKTPYLFSISASITDIGTVTYIADTGSGSYTAAISNQKLSGLNKLSNEDIGFYFTRLVNDTLLNRTNELRKFHVGLPTAFRLSGDYNITDDFNMAVNILLNLRGSSNTVYNPGYVSYFNVSPSYGNEKFRVGIPLTYIGYKTAMLGTTVRCGPFYLGSASFISSILMPRFQIKNLDFYAGLSMTIPHKLRNYYTY